MRTPVRGALMAAAVATMFYAGNALAAHHEKGEGEVKCSGANACKGQGACAGEGHECAGNNECKGKGWIKVGSEEECKEKGGEVMS